MEQVQSTVNLEAKQGTIPSRPAQQSNKKRSTEVD